MNENEISKYIVDAAFKIHTPTAYPLTLRYRGKPPIQVDFKPPIERGGVLTPLRD